jgi:hypothetical protein
MKGTCSDLCKSGFWIHNTLVYSKGALVEFSRKSQNWNLYKEVFVGVRCTDKI